MNVKTFKTDFRTLVLADPTVAGFISDRMFPVIAPAKTPRPFCVYRISEREDILAHDGSFTDARFLVEIDAVADGLETCDDITTALFDYLSGAQPGLTGSTNFRTVFVDGHSEDFEAESELYVATVGFRIVAR